MHKATLFYRLLTCRSEAHSACQQLLYAGQPYIENGRPLILLKKTLEKMYPPCTHPYNNLFGGPIELFAKGGVGSKDGCFNKQLGRRDNRGER